MSARSEHHAFQRDRTASASPSSSDIALAIRASGAFFQSAPITPCMTTPAR